MELFKDSTLKSPTRFSLDRRRVLVVGMGVSGAAVARFLRARGALVTVTDMASNPSAADQIPTLEAQGIQFELAGHRPETFLEAHAIVVSPGVPIDLAPIRQAERLGIPVLGELELASRFISKPIIAVTGTNGKTTTTALLGHILTQAGYRVVVGGNIGTPLTACIDAAETADVLVVEVSSFQLDTADTFRPDIGIILNITSDHLDRYDGLSSYADSKGRLLKNQVPGQFAILNGNDPEVRRVGNPTAAQKWFFHAGATEKGGVFQGDQFIVQTGMHVGIQLDLSCLSQPGIHNKENAAAASLATLAFGVKATQIQAALSTFKGLPHRISPVATVAGVRFYNDSKATNIDAVDKALAAFGESVVLIMGGRNKGYRFDTLADAVKAHAKALIVIGESAQDILDDLKGYVPGYFCKDVDAAVSKAFAVATSGDVVLLSPGCASFDMFENYAERGDAFCRAVTAIEKKSRR